MDRLAQPALALADRALWTLAYLGLGVTAGADLDAAASFLTNPSPRVNALTMCAASGLKLYRCKRPG